MDGAFAEVIKASVPGNPAPKLRPIKPPKRKNKDWGIVNR